MYGAHHQLQCFFLTKGPTFHVTANFTSSVFWRAGDKAMIACAPPNKKLHEDINEQNIASPIVCSIQVKLCVASPYFASNT